MKIRETRYQLIACLIHKKLIFYIYTYPQDPLNRQLSGLVPLPETHQQARQMKMDGWKIMHIIYFVGAKTTHFFMGDVTLNFWGRWSSSRIDLMASHAPCWGPYSLSRPILTGDHLPLCWAVSREKTWGWWLGSRFGEMDRKFVRETRVYKRCFNLMVVDMEKFGGVKWFDLCCDFTMKIGKCLGSMRFSGGFFSKPSTKIPPSRKRDFSWNRILQSLAGIYQGVKLICMYIHIYCIYIQYIYIYLYVIIYIYTYPILIYIYIFT